MIGKKNTSDQKLKIVKLMNTQALFGPNNNRTIILHYYSVNISMFHVILNLQQLVFYNKISLFKDLSE